MKKTKSMQVIANLFNLFKSICSTSLQFKKLNSTSNAEDDDANESVSESMKKLPGILINFQFIN